MRTFTKRTPLVRVQQIATSIFLASNLHSVRDTLVYACVTAQQPTHIDTTPKRVYIHMHASATADPVRACVFRARFETVRLAPNKHIACFLGVVYSRGHIPLTMARMSL